MTSKTSKALAAPNFLKQLASVNPKSGARRWFFVLHDQLSSEIGPLAQAAPGSAGIVLIESRHHSSLRPFHRQRLALLMANQRHFALEQAARGVSVHYVFTKLPFAAALEPVAGKLGPLTAMLPAERETRFELAPLVSAGLLNFVAHGGWLTTLEMFTASHAKPGGPWKMDSFYRHVRQETGILMKGAGKSRGYVGGKVSFDVENRLPYRGPPTDPVAPALPVFKPDAITTEVLRTIETEFAHHPGKLDGSTLPATIHDAKALWTWAKKHCLPHFGPFEDAMSERSRTLFHTRLSALINIHRLLPRAIVSQAEQLDIPLASKEGFIRQILGWREFVRHVHNATEGFRSLASGPVPTAKSPSDAGYSRWSGKPWPAPAHPVSSDGGAEPAVLQANPSPLPSAFWGATSGLNCLDTVVRSVWDEAYSHHITRLMVLANLATLLDVNPRELTDWFWVAYADAYDWVVEPNVLAMGTYSVGGVMTTKPYIAGSAYIDKMSDYCSSCRFDPGSTCPITRLYWAFLKRHEPLLKNNPRVMMPMRSLAKRSKEQLAADAQTFVRVRDVLVNGRELAPQDFSPSGKPATSVTTPSIFKKPAKHA